MAPYWLTEPISSFLAEPPCINILMVTVLCRLKTKLKAKTFSENQKSAVCIQLWVKSRKYVKYKQEALFWVMAFEKPAVQDHMWFHRKLTDKSTWRWSHVIGIRDSVRKQHIQQAVLATVNRKSCSKHTVPTNQHCTPLDWCWERQRMKNVPRRFCINLRERNPSQRACLPTLLHI